MRLGVAAVVLGIIAGLAFFVGAALFEGVILHGDSTMRRLNEPQLSQLRLHTEAALVKAMRGLPTFGVEMSGIGALLAFWVHASRLRTMKRDNVTETCAEVPQFGPWHTETIGVVLLRGVCAAVVGTTVCWAIQLGWRTTSWSPARRAAEHAS